ncbi:MAG: hypothetical protein ACTSUO_08255, partial [Candidatus Thorarchaeota archaeon]
MNTRKRMDISPNTILSTAIYMGLVALTRIVRNRMSKKTRRYYSSIEMMWNNAKCTYVGQNPRQRDFVPIQNAEPNMRGRFLKFLWSSTRRFGNKESNRVYSWLEGSVGPLNSLLNYAGARLRDLTMTLYSFPKPQKFEVRKYADGSKKILTMAEAKKLDDDVVKVYYKYGYERKRKSPRVFLSHPTLAGMDFVDMIRAHCVELCRQCFIYDVPMLESHRYIRLLIHQLKPFLDYVYTGGKKGRKNFNPYADHELRKIVLEIRSLYRKRSKVRKRVSHRNRVNLEPSLELVKKNVVKQLKKTVDEDEQKLLQKILDYIDTEKIIVLRDVEKLVDLVQGLNKREGNIWHRILLADLHHPVSLKQVVYSGNKMLDSPSSILIVAELPVAKHAGKIDLTVFIRREVAGKFIWTPMMVLEVKTKTGFDFNLYGIHLKRKREDTVVPGFYSWKRALNDEEWQSIMTSNPDTSALDQLNEYGYELLAEYKQIVPQDPSPPGSLWKGVIVLDTEQSPSEVFPAFQYLLEDLTTGLIHKLVEQKSTISVKPKPLDSPAEGPRVVLLVTPSKGPADLLSEMAASTSIDKENPFNEREP